MEKSGIGITQGQMTLKRKIAISASVLAVALMIGAALFGAGLGVQFARDLGLAATPRAATPNSSPTPWTYPTTTMQEPGYTNGTYNWAATASVEHLNPYVATDAYSFALIDEIYDSLTELSPNATPSVMPWLATHWNEWNLSASGINNKTTFDPVTGQVMPVKYIWNVTLRPGVQWTDWTPANANDTYTFSNFTSFYAFNPSTGAEVLYNHTYRSWPSMTMRTYYVQSADVILTWKILQSSLDFSGDYINVVNVVPTSNLSVQFYLSSQSASFLFYTLETIVMPYHIWVHHDYATSIATAWNYTGAPNGYDTWNMNYNPSTGTASGLVGSGPFMFNGGYGMPQGQWFPDQYWKEYVNPHYFVQYGPSWMHQFTPKFYELYTPQYLSVSAAATAELLGQVDTIQFGLPPTFLPTIKTMPSTYIYHKPSTSYGYIQLNSYPSNAPYNVTAFRQALNYATDKAYLASVVDEGYDVLGQPIVPVSDSIWHNYSTPQYSYDPTLAWNMINNTTGFSWHGTLHPLSGQWYYYGKPVTADMQITVASEDPLGVEGALIIAKEWDAIGVPTTVTQEAFTTLVSNLITYSYSSINLGITGIFGDPTGDFFAFYNSSVGLGTGFYLGPFSSLTVNGKKLTGTQVDSLMNNLTNELNVKTNFSQRLNIAYEIEGIAAQESTMINLGYPIDILPFTNSTFTGVIKDSLPYLAFMYWNFLSLHLRTAVVTVAPPKVVPIQLHVGVVTPGTVYFNGQTATATVQVRNQYGQPVAGADVDIGYSPQGSLINITSYKLVTNSAGEAFWQFKVLDNNPLIYTSDYAGQINISAAAFMPSSFTGISYPGIGWTHIDVSPQPVAYKTSGVPVLVNGKPFTKYTVEVYNPMTGQPVSNYAYDIQALNGAVEMMNTSSSQSITTTSSYNPIFGFGFDSAALINPLIQSIVPQPSAVAFDPYSGLLFVASYSTGTVYAIETFNAAGIPQVVGTATVGKNPDALLANGAGWLYVANKGSNNVTVISTVTLGSVMNISVGTAPAALAMNATGFVFVANSGSGNVSQINTTGVVNMTYRVGNDPVALAFNATGFLMVANKLSNNLTVINTTSESIVKTPVSSFHNLSAPDAIATNMSGNVLVANMASGNLTVYSPSLAFIGNISIGKTAEPDSILSFAANFTLVADNGTGNVAVVNTTAMKVSLYNETGVNPTSLAMDSSNGQIYLADMGSNNLTQLAAMPVPMTDNMTVMQINSVTDYGLTSIAGVTPANGTISVLLAANPNVNFSVQGSVFLSYVFLGDYAAGGAVAGAAPWDIIGEMTSATNPSGFGVQQPVELPVEVAQSTAAANVTISVTAMNSALSPTASTTLLVRAVNTTTGAPVASYPVTLMSQNALGANRGLLINSTGTPVQAFNPNVFFGSTYIPGITLMTNSTGYAMATFSPGLYTPMYSPNGTFVGFSPQSYTDNYLIPFDEFQITAVGMTGEVGGVTVYSNQSVNNVTPSPVVFAYIAGESSLNGVTVLPGNGTYTMYVNSTENSPYGPSTSGVSVTVSVSLGSVSVSSGTTGSNGSFVISYNAPNVSVLTPVTIGISTGSGTITETIYLVPHYVVTKTITTTVTKTKTVTTTVSSALFEGLTGLFIILTVIFAVLYVSARRKGGNKGSANPPQQ